MASNDPTVTAPTDQATTETPGAETVSNSTGDIATIGSSTNEPGVEVLVTPVIPSNFYPLPGGNVEMD